MTQHIQADRFDSWFSVESVHGSRLEFVLHAAEDRNGKERGFYAEQLFSMLSDTVNKACAGWAAVIEHSNYGDESYLVTTNSPQDLQKALGICSLIVGEWKQKYRVDSMTRL